MDEKGAKMKQEQESLHTKINKTEKYWDKKTLFVHRRALLVGVFLGFILGVISTSFIVLTIIKEYGFLCIIDIVGK